MFSSPAKVYERSKWLVLVDTLDCKAIRRRMYEMKEHMTVEKLLITRLRVTIVKP